MTSSCSADATALPSRRNLIAQAGMLASISAAGATLAVPVLAHEPGTIEAMYAEHVRLSHVYDGALGARYEAEERYEEPERPRWSPAASEGGYKLKALSKDTCQVFLDDSEKNVGELKAKIAAPFVFDPTYVVTELSHRRCVERATETLAQIEAWQAEAKRRADAAGLTQAREAEARAAAATKEHAARVFAIEPTTFRELAFRSAVLLLTWDEDEAEMLPERLAELAGIEPYAFDAAPSEWIVPLRRA